MFTEIYMPASKGFDQMLELKNSTCCCLNNIFVDEVVAKLVNEGCFVQKAVWKFFDWIADFHMFAILIFKFQSYFTVTWDSLFSSSN